MSVPAGGVARRRLLRLALVSLCAVLGTLALGGTAFAAPDTTTAAGSAVALVQQPPAPQPPPATAPPGPDLDQPAPPSGQSVTFGVAIVILAAMVILGRRERARRRKKAEG